ncbi:hypothetical protein ACFXO9_25820 [Nocardia tengchongensis]|uniref:hypothetical protein n=1 Tax=Nocardia tengchongensis TaxID=2055889 RepID=UPI00369638A7
MNDKSDTEMSGAARDLVVGLTMISTHQKEDLGRLFDRMCEEETRELTKAAYASLDLVPRLLRPAVLKVAGL